MSNSEAICKFGRERIKEENNRLVGNERGGVKLVQSNGEMKREEGIIVITAHDKGRARGNSNNQRPCGPVRE